MNYKIVLDAGHGGSDSGAKANGIIEKDLTLKITKYIYDRLKELGIPVTLTRDTDETITPTERVNRILDAYGNNSDVIVVSNHINAGGGDGAEVIYALRNNDELPNIILNNLKEAGQNIRGSYQRRLPSNPSKDYYFIHRNTGKTQPVLIEYGFLDSKLDDVSQLKNNYQELAESVVKSLAQYTNNNYIPPIKEEIIEDNLYTIKSGDTLWNLAKKYNTTVEEIKKLNNLDSNTLKINQKLILPNIEDTYIVKQGDTLYSISKKYNISVSDLKKINNLLDNNISINQVLKLTNDIDNSNYIDYIVKKGDNLYSIAKKYNITQQELMDINNLKSNLLSIGQILKIPFVETETYIVKEGDTLYSIARNYNTTISDIKTKNNLQNDILSIGQILII